MSTQSIIKNYVSEVDNALDAFNRTHTRTNAEQMELDKYKRIYTLRDHAIPPKSKESIWDRFNDH